MTLRVLPNKGGPVKHEDKRRRADIALHALIMALKADYARVILVFHATRDEAIGGKTDGLAQLPHGRQRACYQFHIHDGIVCACL
jgi:hypothetical protein